MTGISPGGLTLKGLNNIYKRFCTIHFKVILQSIYFYLASSWDAI
jgi:hypothetical protein